MRNIPLNEIVVKGIRCSSSDPSNQDPPPWDKNGWYICLQIFTRLYRKQRNRYMPKNTSRMICLSLLAAIVLFGLIQLVPYGRNHTNPPVVQRAKLEQPSTRQLAPAPASIVTATRPPIPGTAMLPRSPGSPSGMSSLVAAGSTSVNGMGLKGGSMEVKQKS